jgi:NAD(P)-dependent dehydrogenase (short-subunit alcohol dehydrogenase family)
LGHLDILVNNAAFQRTHENLWDFTSDEIDQTFRTNIQSMFHLAKAAGAKMKPGGVLINTASIQADEPSPSLWLMPPQREQSQTLRPGWHRSLPKTASA